NRDLLASEQRSFDKSMQESTQISELIRDVELRTDGAYRPPSTLSTRTMDDEPGIALRNDQSVAEWSQRSGGELVRPGAFGRVLRSWIFGDKRGLNDCELRAQAEGTDSAGGFTVPTPLAVQFIDRVRNNMAVNKAGATTVPMDSETLSIARLAQPGLQESGSP